MGLITKKFGAKKNMRIQSKGKSSDDLKSSGIKKSIKGKQKKRSNTNRNIYFPGQVTRTHQQEGMRNRLKTSKAAFKIHDTEIATNPEGTNVVSMVKHTLKLENVESCVSAMLKFNSRNSKSKNHQLFEDEAQPIHMIVQCVRVPVMKNKNYRFCLPNPLIQESSEVCLFVPNLKKGKSEDHEPTIEHYKDILEKHKVKGISQIIPLRQVHVEYDQFELRRRLVSQFDMFLADGRITGHIQGLIGKEIHKRQKLPAPINFRAKDLKKEVDTALSKTLMMMNGHGDKSSLKVGHTKHSVSQITENIMAIADGLAERFPGGWENIRSLQIHLQNGVPVPIYMSLKNSNDVEVPVVTHTQPKKAVPVEGELSTMPGVHVKVLPDGEVVIKKKKLTKQDREMGLSDSDLEDFDPDEEMDVNASDEEIAPEDQVKVESVQNPEESEDDNAESDVSSVDGDEQVVDAAENVYLNEWRDQWNENIKENSKKMRNKTVGEDMKIVPQAKKPKIVKNKIQKKTSNKVKSKEIENKNSGNNKKDPQSLRKNIMKKNIKSSNTTSPLIVTSKKLKVKGDKQAKSVKKSKPSKMIAKKKKL